MLGRNGPGDVYDLQRGSRGTGDEIYARLVSTSFHRRLASGPPDHLPNDYCTEISVIMTNQSTFGTHRLGYVKLLNQRYLILDRRAVAPTPQRWSHRGRHADR